jgi:NADPH:quinone reductase-like Zn-dependent oxidoreductase
MFAVQLAHWRGAHVIGTASASNLEFVRSIGADEAIDYRNTRFEDVVSNVDVVFDAVGGETLLRSWAVLAAGGRVVTVAAGSKDLMESHALDAFMLVSADAAQLSQIAGLIDAGELRIFIEEVFPLKKVREAYARAAEKHLRGKIILQVGQTVCE